MRRQVSPRRQPDRSAAYEHYRVCPICRGIQGSGQPLYALLVQLGCYEACASHGLPAVITWLCFIIPAVVALCASAPVCAILNGIANIWYKTLPALFSRRG